MQRDILELCRLGFGSILLLYKVVNRLIPRPMPLKYSLFINPLDTVGLTRPAIRNCNRQLTIINPVVSEMLEL